MKSNYVKPQLRIEYFSLTQSVAAHCGWALGASYGTPNHGDAHECAWVMADGERVFMTVGPDLCSDEYPENQIIGTACYNAPTGADQIFAS